MSFSEIRDWALFFVLAAGAVVIVIFVGVSLPPKSTQLDRIEAKIDALQSTADQTVDFLSDLHAERAKP